MAGSIERHVFPVAASVKGLDSLIGGTLDLLHLDGARLRKENDDG